MPADIQYLEKFYDKGYDSPKGDVSKEEFLANVEYFFREFRFTKTEEKAEPENTILGWDNLGAEIVKGIGKELAEKNHPSTEEHVAGLIMGKFNGLGKLLSGEMGRLASRRRISDSELVAIGSRLFEERKKFFGGLSLVGAIAEIRHDLVTKGIQEYIDSIGIAKPPSWKGGYIYLPEPDDEGWDYSPPYVAFLNYEEDRRRGVWRIDWEPFHEVANELFAGKKLHPNMGDFKFYPIAEIIKKINFKRNTVLPFTIEGKCHPLQFDPQEISYMGKGGALISLPKSNHTIASGYYQKFAPRALGEKEKASFAAMCKMVERSLARKRQARIQKFEYGIKHPRFHPSADIFKAQRNYKNYASCFGHLMGYMVQCGILNMGGYVTKADYFSTPPLSVTHLQIAVKNMGTHILARVRWLDPPFLGGHRNARQFLLCGFRIRSTNDIKLPRYRQAQGYSAKNTFLSFEVPTACAFEIPLLGPGMPLYDEEFYGLWQKGKVPSINIFTQFYSLYQGWDDYAVVPASTTSYMPKQTLILGNAPPMPRHTNLGEF